MNVTTRAELESAQANPNVQAFLQVVRAGEGTADEIGYRRIFGGDLFEGFADHPRQFVTRTSRGNSITSSAAGAYQFLASTWDMLVKRFGFEDFSPANQDLGAIALIAGRHALEDVIGGNFDEAVLKCGHEWASLPGSPYGQPQRTLAQAQAVFAANGGEVAEA